MTVKELIEKLQSVPPELPVYLASDEEGNSFDTLTDVEESPLNHDCYPCHPNDADEDADRVVVLWP